MVRTAVRRVFGVAQNWLAFRQPKVAAGAACRGSAQLVLGFWKLGTSICIETTRYCGYRLTDAIESGTFPSAALYVSVFRFLGMYRASG